MTNAHVGFPESKSPGRNAVAGPTVGGESQRSHTPVGRLPDAWTGILVRVAGSSLAHLGEYAAYFSAAERIGKLRMYEAVLARVDLEVIMAEQKLKLAMLHLRPNPGYSLPVLRKGRTHVAALVPNPLLVDVAWREGFSRAK
jgi:hypothetical protein